MGFGSFDSICKKTALPLCGLVGPPSGISNSAGIPTECYSRSIEVANTIIYQGAASFMHIIALIMTVFMIFHVRSKFTAVGRKEITNFFYFYFILTIFSLIIDSGVVPPGSSPFPYFVAIQNGLVSALCTCLLVNGFVGFQLYGDGTPLSVWLLRIFTSTMFIITFLISLLTFKSWGGLGPTNTIGLFIVLYLINAIFVAVYIITQFIVVIRTLNDRWLFGDLIFGTFFFIVGQVALYAFGHNICEGAQHYLDGFFIATTCNLLAVMMIYKFWDSLTKEDLEFSVAPKPGLSDGFNGDRSYHMTNSEVGLDPSHVAIGTSDYHRSTSDSQPYNGKTQFPYGNADLEAPSGGYSPYSNPKHSDRYSGSGY